MEGGLGVGKKEREGIARGRDSGTAARRVVRKRSLRWKGRLEGGVK